MVLDTFCDAFRERLALLGQFVELRLRNRQRLLLIAVMHLVEVRQRP